MTASRYLEAMASSTRRTAKYCSYGPLYDLVLDTLPADPTVLEIGIANGGSLQTWRTLLGPRARIIGVDLNERARALEVEGFEVMLLDTGDPASWSRLGAGLDRQVDLLVDDGGHTNRQQIASVLFGVDLVADGGWLVIEDLHASFMGEFGNPSPYSTARFLNELASDLHRRHPRSEVAPRHPNLASAVNYVVVGTSWAGLRIDRRVAGSADEVTAGEDDTLMDYDHRWDASFGGLPTRVGAVLRNRYTGSLASVWGRRLFRSDARAQRQRGSQTP
jgi:hypothetical protein